jgi:carboxypeptidase C (cathepsin A)
MIPYFDYFVNSTSLKMMVYSGDADTVLSFVGTQTWILSLQRPVKSAWAPWYYTNANGEQTAGWSVMFDRLTFTTIKGAGHMVPWYQPGPALRKYITILLVWHYT